VEYVDLQGWQSSTKGARAWSDLPLQAQKYIEFIESFIGIQVCCGMAGSNLSWIPAKFSQVIYIGTGQDREDMIFVEMDDED